MEKDVDAYRTISEVAETLDIPPHVLRFWESRFPQIKPLKRGGGRRYYRRSDTDLLGTIRRLLYEDGYTIRGVQRLLKSKGAAAVASSTAKDLPPAADMERSEWPGDGDDATRPECDGRRAAIASLTAEIAACRALLHRALERCGEGEGAAIVP